MGHYALYGIDNPSWHGSVITICTEGEYSCLHFQAWGRVPGKFRVGYWQDTKAEFRVRQLQAMFPPNHMWAQFVPGNVWELVVSFLD